MDKRNLILRLQDYFSRQPVSKAWLFGSYSRGEATSESDIDILVIFDEGVGLFKYASMVADLEDLLKNPVDLVSEGALFSWVKEEIEKDKILIYERKTA